MSEAAYANLHSLLQVEVKSPIHSPNHPGKAIPGYRLLRILGWITANPEIIPRQGLPTIQEPSRRIGTPDRFTSTKTALFVNLLKWIPKDCKCISRIGSLRVQQILMLGIQEGNRRLARRPPIGESSNVIDPS